MAQIHGKHGLVALGTGTAASGQNVVAEVVSWSAEYTAETYQTTEPTLNNPTPALTYTAGPTSWTATVECKLDPTDTNGQEAMSIGAGVTVNLYYQTTNDGSLIATDKMYQGAAIVTGISRSVSQGDIETVSFSLQGSGALTETALAT